MSLYTQTDTLPRTLACKIWAGEGFMSGPLMILKIIQNGGCLDRRLKAQMNPFLLFYTLLDAITFYIAPHMLLDLI